jgi:RNA polymerase sigma-70 factor (ECF subfamily)
MAVAATHGDDVELLTLIGAGDTSAFEELYRRYGRLAFSLCLRLLGDRSEAEEVAQDAFVRVWRHAGRYDATRGTPVTWLLTITHHLAIDHVRRRRSDAIPNTPGVEAAIAATPQDHGERAEARVFEAEVVRAIRNLPFEQRQALWLTYFADYTQREIADSLAIPIGTVKSRVRLGLRSLRQLILGSASPSVRGEIIRETARRSRPSDP